MLHIPQTQTECKSPGKLIPKTLSVILCTLKIFYDSMYIVFQNHHFCKHFPHCAKKIFNVQNPLTFKLIVQYNRVHLVPSIITIPKKKKDKPYILHRVILRAPCLCVLMFVNIKGMEWTILVSFSHLE